MNPSNYINFGSQQNWTDSLVSSFQQVWNNVAGFVPALIVAIIVLFIGWIIGMALGSLVNQIVKTLKVDKLFEKTEFKKVLEKSKINLDSGAFLGAVVKWIIILAFLMASTEILNLPQITVYIGDVLGYLLNVIAAVIILGIGIFLANFVYKVVKSSLELAKMSSASFVAALAKWAILIFAFIAALAQLRIATYFLNVLFIGIVAFLAIAGGLAFGMGGQDTAKELLHKIKDDISEEK